MKRSDSTADDFIHHLRHEVLQVDKKWSLARPGGFSWWPHRFRQDIYKDRQKTSEDGTLLERVVVSTEVARLNPGVTSTHPLLVKFAKVATLSGLVLHQGVLSLHAHAWVDASNYALYSMLLGATCGLQNHEACIISALLHGEGLASPAESPHPQGGLRASPDEIALFSAEIYNPEMETESPWPEQMLEDILDQYLDAPPCMMSTADPSGLTAEFPFGEASSLLEVIANQRNPFVGGGMLVLSKFDTAGIDDPFLNDPIAQNAWEIEHADYPFMGSWCLNNGDERVFVTFIPNILSNPTVPANVILIGGARAKRMSMKWLDDDWSETWDEEGNCRAKTAMERMMESSTADGDDEK